MASYCQAILVNNLGVLIKGECSNHSMDASLFCEEHQSISYEEHKMRWMRKFINGADGEPFLYGSDESKKDRILEDLENKIITLTPRDINLIAARRKTLDTYILLFENGYLTLENHNSGLYKHSIQYLSEFWFLGERFPAIQLTPLAKKIRDLLVLKDASHLRYFLYDLPYLMDYYAFQGILLDRRFSYISTFLSEILESDAARELSWEPFQNEIVSHYERTIGKDHILTCYFRDSYVSQYITLYKTEKQMQKERIDSLKEELMAITWHPDRFLRWCIDEDEKRENECLFA